MCTYTPSLLLLPPSSPPNPNPEVNTHHPAELPVLYSRFPDIENIQTRGHREGRGRGDKVGDQVKSSWGSCWCFFVCLFVVFNGEAEAQRKEVKSQGPKTSGHSWGQVLSLIISYSMTMASVWPYVHALFCKLDEWMMEERKLPVFFVVSASWAIRCDIVQLQ